MAPAIGVAEWNELKCDGELPRGRYAESRNPVVFPVMLVGTREDSPSGGISRNGHTLTMAGRSCIMFGGMTEVCQSLTSRGVAISLSELGPCRSSAAVYPKSSLKLLRPCLSLSRTTMRLISRMRPT